MLRTCLCITFLVILVHGWSPTERLQNDAIPSSYTLKLAPNVTDDTYSGEVSIFIRVDHSVQNITLNSKKLSITEISLDQGPTDFKLDPGRDMLHVFYYENQTYIDPGEHLLHIKFKGSLSGHPFGLYSTNVDENGVKSKIVASKFSPLHAREAFPCFDEPSFKSIFNIRLIKPNDSWTALSNMREIGSFKTAEGIAVDFQTTPPISTYSLVFILTTFSFDETHYVGKNNRNISMRFFSDRNQSLLRIEALDKSKKILRFYEDYVDIPYDLPKLDFIEVPIYPSGGMEHWGMVVYRQHEIFPNLEVTFVTSPLYRSIKSLALIAHELSHMWFGNLVTHQWYHNLWLTEGFARFMQYKALYHTLKEPFVKMLFQKEKGMSLIELACVDPLNRGASSFIRSRKEVKYIFSPASYDMGAAILTMLEDAIGPKNFQTAVRLYLKEHEYKDVTTNDFINMVQKVVPTVNVRYFMESYLFQKNVPLIIVTEDSKNFILKQKPLCNNFGEYGYKWTIPIRYITSGNQTGRLIWFNQDSSQLKIPKLKDDKWIKINFMNLGHYRALYTNELYALLYENFLHFGTEDKSALLEETFLMTSEGHLSYAIPFLLLGQLKDSKEIDFLTFAYASRSYSLYRQEKHPNLDVLTACFVNTFEGLYRRTKWTLDQNETFDQRLLKAAVLESFCLSDIKYHGCYASVDIIRQQNVTVDPDISYIYDDVVGRLKKKQKKSTEKGQETKCPKWLKENLLSILHKPNDISKLF